MSNIPSTDVDESGSSADDGSVPVTSLANTLPISSQHAPPSAVLVAPRSQCSPRMQETRKHAIHNRDHVRHETSIGRAQARRRIIKRMLKISVAFSAFGSTNGVEEGSGNGHALPSATTLRPNLPDPELYPEETVNRFNPVKGWSDMELLDQFLWRWEEYFTGEALKAERSEVEKALKICAKHANLTMSAIYVAQHDASFDLHHFVPTPEHTHPPTPQSLLDRYFAPPADRLTEHIAATAALLDPLIAALALLKRYGDLLATPTTAYRTMPTGLRTQLDDRIARVTEEYAARVRQYTTLLVFLSLLELKRASWLGAGKTPHLRFVEGMRYSENVRGCMAEMRRWVKGGGRVERVGEWMGILEGVMERWE